MFWIKDRHGNPVNLAFAVRIYAHQPKTDGDYEVLADVQSGEFVLFIGSREASGRYRDELFRALKERERNQMTDWDYLDSA